MKILLYSQDTNSQVFCLQQQALESAGISYTLDPWDPDYDILEIHTCDMNADAICKHAREQGKKIIYHINKVEQPDIPLLQTILAPGMKKWTFRLYSQADAFLTPTEYTKKHILSHGLKKHIYIVSDVIDLAHYHADYEKIIAYRKYFSLKPEDQVIIGKGRLAQNQGILDFIEVAKMLPQYKFIWFGDLTNLFMTGTIRNAIDNHPDNVMFPGYVEGPILEGAYTDAECAFFPAYSEVETHDILEALASSCQVLTRRIPVYDGWLSDENNCYQATDNAAFARIIHDCLSHTLPSTVQKGYQLACTSSIQKIGQQLKTIYEQVSAA